MSGSFQLVALDARQFEALFRRSDEELRALHARRMVVDDKPGFPCRVSLADAEVGETVVLLPFTHHDVPTPYHGIGPIFVRQGVATTRPAPEEIPDMFRHRLLSLRAYDAEGMLLASEVVEGTQLEQAIRRQLDDPSADYLHINAKPGCYNCRVARV
jgi:hypothetical protein